VVSRPAAAIRTFMLLRLAGISVPENEHIDGAVGPVPQHAIAAIIEGVWRSWDVDAFSYDLVVDLQDRPTLFLRIRLVGVVIGIRRV
jgi:hypothetical protein